MVTGASYSRLGSRALFGPELLAHPNALRSTQIPSCGCGVAVRGRAMVLFDVVGEEHNDAVAIAKPKCANRSVNSNGRANIVARIFVRQVLAEPTKMQRFADVATRRCVGAVFASLRWVSCKHQLKSRRI